MTVTKRSWADSLLRGLGDPVTPANERALVGWENAEGGNWNNSASFNPLNTTEAAPGATAMNGVGVKAYPSWQEGLQATIQTLKNGRYQSILDALKSGNNPTAVANAIGSSPWGTNASLVASAIGSASAGAGGSTVPTPTPASTSLNVPTVSAPSGPNIFTTLGGLEAARQAIGGDTSGTPDAIQSGWDALSALIAPNSSTVTNVKQPNSVRQNMSGLSGGDIDPLQGWTIGRTDMGVDASASVGKGVLAPNNSRVVHIYPGWYQHQPYVLLQLTSGPNKGKYYYIAEQIDNLPKVGSYIPRGGVIARFAPSGTGIEMGWGTPSQATQAQATTGYTEGQVTPAGQSFKSTFNINLAKAPTNTTPQPVAGTVPANQPSTPTLPKVPDVNPSLVGPPSVKPSVIKVPGMPSDNSVGATNLFKLPKVA